MKKSSLLVMILMVFITANVFGQLQSGKSEVYKIESDSVAIGYSKTTTIVFPYAIKSVDRGNGAVLVQKVKGVENILQLKAAQHDFTETNLTVVTSDDQLYSFVLNYDEQTPVLNLVVSKAKRSLSEPWDSAVNDNEAVLQSYAALASYEKKKVHGIKDNKYNMLLQLNGLFIHENVMYYRIKVENNSNINYDISQLRFFIRDQIKVKRTASQEIEIKPLYILNNTAVIQGNTTVCFVFALAKITIPEEKYLAIQLMEDKGGRHLELQVNNKKLMQLGILPVL
ncbi:conjugative transposon protein TraN [Flavobacterium sp. ZS1P14]|uniref:conjugative transposon protein TraN n=1 Tax=Flavobacterium sp. ZS1P14 TaxID=3401729 RepID=UPI003AAF9727